MFLPRSFVYSGVAAVARQVYLHKGLGVGALKRMYGGAKRRGSRPSKHAAGSGSVQRHALQALEKLKIVEKESAG